LHDQEELNDINAQFNNLIEIAKTCASQKKKVAFFIYYSGHGLIVDGMTVGNTTLGIRVPLEANLRKLAIRPNSYVISLLDCCREVQRTPVVTKGQGDSVPEKIAGQYCIIHAVGPSKSAVAVRKSVKDLSEVTKDFLQVMNSAKLTFPACLQQWAKAHATVELVDKCSYELQLTPNTVLPADMVSMPPLREWTQEHVCLWLKSLHLSRDFTAEVKEESIDGSSLASIFANHITWKEAGLPVTGGDLAKIKEAVSRQKLAQ